MLSTIINQLSTSQRARQNLVQKSAERCKKVQKGAKRCRKVQSERVWHFPTISLGIVGYPPTNALGWKMAVFGSFLRNSKPLPKPAILEVVVVKSSHF